jgi:hypothetical protein
MTNACPGCRGLGQILATGIQYAEGHSGPYCGEFPCDRCNGSGEIPDEMVRWIEHGKVLKKRPLSQRMNLISWSALRGMTLMQWSYIERGMVNNLGIE